MLQLAAITAAIPFLRFEFNPAAIGPSGVDAFRELMPLISNGFVSYDKFSEIGKVTRLDIAVDLLNIDLDDLLISTQKPGVTKGYFGLTGKLETKYLNVNKKGSKLYVYDRKVLLEKQNADGVGTPSKYGAMKYTRVEIRVQPNVAVAKLNSIHNRLTKVDLIDIEAVDPPEQAHHWQLFQDSCRYRGLAGALGKLPASIRPAYESAINKCSGALWNPELLWDAWPGALISSHLL